MPTDTPQITTIIPTYRRPHLLRRAIRSVLDQTYRDLQVCIYDNASGDETAAVVAAFARADPRVKYHCHPENIGLSANFTYAMEHIATPYFSILSDDDYLLPTFYETALAGFTRHPDAMLSAGLTISMTERGEIMRAPLSAWRGVQYYSPPNGLFRWTIDAHPPVTGILFRREVITHAGLLDPELLNSDYDYEWRVISQFPFVVSAVLCAVIIAHEQQATRRADLTAWWKSYQTMRAHLRENEMIAPDARAQAEQVLRTTFGNVFFVLGVLDILDEQFSRAHQVMTILTERFNMRRKAYILGVPVWLCERSRLFVHLLRGAYKIRKMLRTAKYRSVKASIVRYIPEA